MRQTEDLVPMGVPYRSMGEGHRAWKTKPPRPRGGRGGRKANPQRPRIPHTTKGVR